MSQPVAIPWPPRAGSCTPFPQLLTTLPYKGWGSMCGTKLTSCLCALSSVDYNREWEEEPLALCQPSRRLPGIQDNPLSSHWDMLS